MKCERFIYLLAEIKKLLEEREQLPADTVLTQPAGPLTVACRNCYKEFVGHQCPRCRSTDLEEIIL